MLDLSILICSVHTRHETFLPRIHKQLYGQYNALSEDDRQRVEIVTLTDTKTMMLGHKRNLMVDIAQGKYVAFVDDDDRVSDDYLASLLDAVGSDADSIVFMAEVSINGEAPRTCHYSKDVRKDYNTETEYYRIPNHICCVKKEVSLKSSFPNILRGEDSGYGKVLLQNLKTEHKIGKILYYYDYSDETTETQFHRKNRSRMRPGVTPIVDVIILSHSATTRTRRMTQAAVNTCIDGANGLPVNVIVIEGRAGRYENAQTVIKREKFNYNAFANYGAALGSAEWIMIANNDLAFHDGWLHELIAAGHDIVSPKEPRDSRQKDMTENTVGDICGRHLSGWCFMIKRTLWEKIGGFDTDVDFWCSDDVVIEQVRAEGVLPMLVPSSLVTHNSSSTLKLQNQKRKEDLTWRNVYTFNEKYGKDKFSDNPGYMSWVKRNIESTGPVAG